MGEYLNSGAVYIFENSEAQRVKVGLTAIGVNDVGDRLRVINDMWLGRKVTCQICAGRLLNIMGLVPQHVISGRDCFGGNALPLEKDVALAESYREIIKNRLGQLSGSEKGSATRIVKTLKKRIEKYRHYRQPVGMWEFKAAFYTGGVSEVEFLSHKILEERLDKLAPFGEVFSCSASEATEAVESALSQLGLLNSARKKTQL